jgi:uncharacterized protein
MFAIYFRVLKKMTDGFADRSAAWLAENRCRDAERFEARGQPVHLSGFPAAFGAFKRDQRHGARVCVNRLALSNTAAKTLRGNFLVPSPPSAEIFRMTDAVTADFLPMLSAAAAPESWCVVSLHDVAPSTHAQSAEILDELKTAGIPVTSLLVVPDYHHRGKAIENAHFVSWLRKLEEEGHEIVIHGYYHQRPRRNGENLVAKFLTRFYTSDEGEFFDLSSDEALARITRARDEFRSAKLSPIGFIAPAWLLNREGKEAAGEAGMQYTTRLGSVIDLLTGESQPARSLVYSTRAAWRQSASLAWNAALVRGAEMRELVRLSIHPADFAAPKIRSQILRLAQRFARTRRPTTYRDWIAQQRRSA